MIKITLICECCGVMLEKKVDPRGSRIILEIEEISKFDIYFDSKGKSYLLCPDCLEKLGVILDENSKESDRKICVFLHREALT